MFTLNTYPEVFVNSTSQQQQGYSDASYETRENSPVPSSPVVSTDSSFNQSQYSPSYPTFDRNNSLQFSQFNSSACSNTSFNECSNKLDSLQYFSIEAILARPDNKVVPNIELVKSKRNRKRALSTKAPSKADAKRLRTIFTQDQLDALELEFEKQQYMVGSERTYLAHSLKLTESQVKIWFQNRRIKWRKHVDDKRVDGSIDNSRFELDYSLDASQ